VRLDRGLLHVGHAVGFFEHAVGRGEARRHVAHLGHDLGRQVARRVPDARRVLLVVDARRVLVHRALGVEERRQHLVLDLDRLARLLRQLGILGRHHRHAVADEAHLAVEHHGVVRRRFGPALPGRGVGHARHVLVREHAGDAWHRAGARRVDAHDPRVRVGRVQDARVEQRRQRDVVHEGAAAGRQLDRVDAALGAADGRERLHASSSGTPRAARRTASTGFT
jgi:hypothetical protein